MDDVSSRANANRSAHFFRIARFVLLYGLVAVGALTLAGVGLVGCMRKTMYVTDRIGSVTSPDGGLRIVGEVTRGGLGTVWTTRLYVEDEDEDDDGGRALIYQNKDSDYVPKVRWIAPERAAIVVHCGRVDHFANPQAFAEGTKPIDRLRIRWVYDHVACAKVPKGDV